MARKRGGRRSFNLRKVRVAGFTNIGALVALDVISDPITNASTNPFRLMSMDIAWGLANLGATVDDGQEFGVAHSDYTDAEIEECLEAQASIDVGDKVAQERSNRLVRTIGQIVGNAGTGAGMNFNDGRKLKTKLNWRMGIGDTLSLWVRNGSDTVYTTGARLTGVGNIWVKDGL